MQNGLYLGSSLMVNFWYDSVSNEQVGQLLFFVDASEAPII